MVNNTLIVFVTLMLSSSIQSRNCPWGNDPVCGVNYVTYANQCAIAAAYVEVLYNRPCTKIMTNEGVLESNCPQYYSPVCRRDGVTYLNECTLKDNDTILAHNGTCEDHEWKAMGPPRVCDCKGEKFHPICSLAGYTFENKCVLNCTQQIS